jgi:putative transposase
MERFGLSERRACGLVGQHRSTQRLPALALPPAEEGLRARLRQIAREHPRWGYRRAAVQLRREGHRENHKRVQRLWREEGLRVPQKTRKRRRGQSTDIEGGGEGARRRAQRPGEVWALDFQFDATNDGRQLKCLNVIDEHTRQALATEVARSCDADGLLTVLDRLRAAHGAPVFLRMDNGPELIAQALRDWCRFNTTGTIYIEPGSPWENPFIESFNSRMRDEHWNTEEFTTLTEAQILTETWRIEYNTIRPHSALGGLAPDAYAAVWQTTTTNKQDQPTPTLS